MRHPAPPRRARWYLIAAIPARALGGEVWDACNTIECWTITRRGARRLAEAYPPPPGGTYIVERRSDWDLENS